MSDPLPADQPGRTTTAWPPHLRPVPASDERDDPAVRRAALVAELKQLRRGRGIFASHIDEHVGPAVREFAAISTDDGPAEIRLKVARRISNLAEGLPGDLRAALLTALAIAPDARHPLYKDRVTLAADRIRRDPRTARRRIDDAIVQLAQRATARPGFTGPIAVSSINRPRISELRLSLALDRERPEVVEQCRFTADRDGLGEITPFTCRVPAFAGLPAPELSTDILYGGVFEPPAADQVRRTPSVRLPKPLGVGETHEYVLHSVVSSPESLPSEIRFVADGHCEQLELRVRFDRTRLPIRVESIEDGDYPLRPDEAGEVLVTYVGLTPGCEYGVRWE
jgi:hypothetical protein